MAVVLITAVGVSFAGSPSTQPTTTPTRKLALPSPTEIRQTVRQLNHPSPTQRGKALRKLAYWGPLAFGELRRAAEGTDFEAALSARELLQELESAAFFGSQVHLKVDRQRMAWHESVTLTVHVENPSSAPILVTWPTPMKPTATQPNQVNALQVGAVLDAADFLEVTGPQGVPVDLRIDPIHTNPAVFAAVEVRAGNNPPSHIIPAGQADHLAIAMFNRGWARFPMLRAGPYRVRFVYQPRWKDRTWVEQGLGRVVSEPVTVEVTEGAPEVVRQSSRPLRLRVTCHKDLLVAELQNTWDRDQWVNLNIGGTLPTHAKLEWQPILSDEQSGEAMLLDTDATSPQFEMNRVKRIGPAETAVVRRTPAARIIKLLGGPTDPEHGQTRAVLRYSYFQSSKDLRRHLFAIGQSSDIPIQLFTGSVTSNPVALGIPKTP